MCLFSFIFKQKCQSVVTEGLRAEVLWICFVTFFVPKTSGGGWKVCLSLARVSKAQKSPTKNQKSPTKVCLSLARVSKAVVLCRSAFLCSSRALMRCVASVICSDWQSSCSRASSIHLCVWERECVCVVSLSLSLSLSLSVHRHIYIYPHIYLFTYITDLRAA